VTRAIALRIIILAVFGVQSADRYDEFAHVATALMHANTASLMLLPWLRKRFAGLGPWARLIRLRNRFDALLSAQGQGWIQMTCTSSCARWWSRDTTPPPAR